MSQLAIQTNTEMLVPERLTPHYTSTRKSRHRPGMPRCHFKMNPTYLIDEFMIKIMPIKYVLNLDYDVFPP